MRGPDEAYASLFRTEFARVRRTIHVLTGDLGAAEDITQDAFVQALLHWRKVSAYERPDAWVRRVAIRMAVRHLKRESRRQLVEATAEVAATWRGSDPDLMAAVRTLPAKQQAVLVLFYFDDRPMKEIAALLGMAESTGFVHLHRARSHLASVLGEEVSDDSRA